MKHTPKPWKIDEMTGCIYGPDDKPIQVCGKHAYLYGEGTAETLANNYLFYASPDLLEAAKLALEKCPFPVGAMKAKEALTIAIAKAEAKK